jgi:hypothetical protein
MEKRDNALEPERRIAPAPVVKQKEGKKGATMYGYACLFNSTYNMGWFTEEISPTAFKTADMTDVCGLFNHNVDNIMGRNTAGTLRLGIDQKGLWYEISLPRSPRGKDMRVALERGDITGSSWSFLLNQKDGTGDTWTTGSKGKLPHRIITDVAMVFDVGPVTSPANPAATAGIYVDQAKRSYHDYQIAIGEAKHPAEDLAAFHKRQAQLREMERFIRELKQPVPAMPEAARQREERISKSEREIAELFKSINSAATRAQHRQRVAWLEQQMSEAGLPHNYFERFKC